MRNLRPAAAAVTAIAALLLSSCSSAGSGASAAAPDFTQRGPITLAIGAVSGGPAAQTAVDQWNAAHPDEKVTLNILSAKSGEQQQQVLQNAQTKSDAFTVIALDTTLVPQFAANRWIDPLPSDKFDLSAMFPSTVKTATYRGQLYAVPLSTDGGMLYYRSDLLAKAKIDKPPTTYDEIAADCAAVRKLPGEEKINCYAGQFDKYEGLTCNFQEIVGAAGGAVVDADGKPSVDTAQAKQGLNLLAGWFKDGTIPAEAITYNEPLGEQSFLAGDLLFHRQWAYQWADATNQEKSQVVGKFDVAPLPAFSGTEGGHSVLGGKNLVLSSFGKNKGTAVDFITFFDTQENQTQVLTATGQAPTFQAVYHDQAVLAKRPYLATLERSILNAVPRPSVPNYTDVSAAIQAAVYPALQGKTTTDDALSGLQSELATLIK
jgi:multiple sugar transport system substrate-binding protein